MEDIGINLTNFKNKIQKFIRPAPENRLRNYTALILFFGFIFIFTFWNIEQLTVDFENHLRSSTYVLFYGLSYSMLLFIFVSGFFMIFGLADVINFAHGGLFMLGGFISIELFPIIEQLFLPLIPSNNFLLSFISFITVIISTSIILGGLGAIMEILTIRRLYGNPIAQILLTTGFLYIILKVAEIIWGVIQQYSFRGVSTIGYFFIAPTDSIKLFGASIQLYRVLIIIIGIILAISLFLLISKTKIGLIIQAGIEDSEMVQALGINTKKMFLLVFILGIALAGLAGAIIVPDRGVSIRNGTDYLLYAFVIVVIGGAHHGRLSGTFVASLIIGFSFTFCEYFLPGWQSVIIFLIMAFVLIFKPGGLTGE